jgi:hypothetical protein
MVVAVVVVDIQPVLLGLAVAALAQAHPVVRVFLGRQTLAVAAVVVVKLLEMAAQVVQVS